jgi:hypothetical protein
MQRIGENMENSFDIKNIQLSDDDINDLKCFSPRYRQEKSVGFDVATAIGAVTLSIAANASYDSIKGGIRIIYAKIKARSEKKDAEYITLDIEGITYKIVDRSSLDNAISQLEEWALSHINSEQ